MRSLGGGGVRTSGNGGWSGPKVEAGPARRSRPQHFFVLGGTPTPPALCFAYKQTLWNVPLAVTRVRTPCSSRGPSAPMSRCSRWARGTSAPATAATRKSWETSSSAPPAVSGGGRWEPVAGPPQRCRAAGRRRLQQSEVAGDLRRAGPRGLGMHGWHITWRITGCPGRQLLLAARLPASGPHLLHLRS